MGRAGLEVPIVHLAGSPRVGLLSERLRSVNKEQRRVKDAVTKVEPVQRGFTFGVWPLREAPHCCVGTIILYEVNGRGSGVGRGAYVGASLIETFLEERRKIRVFRHFFSLM